MKHLDQSWTKKEQRPVKVLQFGEGNFLRAFVDYFIDIANEKEVFDGNVVIVKPIQYGSLEQFYNQDCQYTVSLRGVQNGKAQVQNRIVSSVATVVDCYQDYNAYAAYAKLESLRFIVSNTTEAGIVYDDTDRFDAKPPKTYPGKLTKLLYDRFYAFNADVTKGLIILPVELIDDNGIELEHCVKMYAKQWKLGTEFVAWLDEACVFTSTLVDRIVTGYPKNDASSIWKELGYRDYLLDTAEPFGLWVIESRKDISEEFPLHKAGLPVLFTDNQKPYKQRKVRILNGAHTSFVLASYLVGNDIVLESMKDKLIFNFMKRTIFDEVIPTLTLPKEDLVQFANAVIERFKNPYVKHSLLSISLNSVSKWKARCMPSYLEYIRMKEKLPAHLTFSLAALMAFYSGDELSDGVLIGHRDGEEYEIHDDANVLEFFYENAKKSSEEYTKAVLGNVEFWDENLASSEAVAQVSEYLEMIRSKGMRATLEHYFPVK